MPPRTTNNKGRSDRGAPNKGSRRGVVESPPVRDLGIVGEDALDADFPSSPPTRSASPLHSTVRSHSMALHQQAAFHAPSDSDDEDLTVECDDDDGLQSGSEDENGDESMSDSSGMSVDFTPVIGRTSDYDPFMADSSPAPTKKAALPTPHQGLHKKASPKTKKSTPVHNSKDAIPAADTQGRQRRDTNPHISPSSTIVVPEMVVDEEDGQLDRNAAVGSATSLNTQRTEIAPYSSFANLSLGRNDVVDADPVVPSSRQADPHIALASALRGHIRPTHERTPTDLRIETSTSIAGSPKLHFAASPVSARRASFQPHLGNQDGSPCAAQGGVDESMDGSPTRRTGGYLSRDHLEAIYDMLDLDEDGVVSAQDLYAFLALNPACIVPALKDGVSAGSPHRGRGGTHSSSKATAEPSLEVELLHGKRVDDALRERSFVEFFLKMSYSIACRAAGRQTGSIVEDTLAEQTHLSAAVPSFVSRDAFVGLHSEVVRILTSKGSSYLYVVLDMPMLRILQCFFTFIRRLARKIGALKEHPTTTTTDAADTSLPTGSPKGSKSTRHVPKPSDDPKALSLKQQSSSTTSEGTTSYNGSVGAIYRMLTSWEQPRGLFQVPFLQRLGELYLRSKAEKQERDMQQFVRFYRHLFHTQATSASSGRQGGRSAALANLSLLRLSAKFQLVEGGSKPSKKGRKERSRSPSMSRGDMHHKRNSRRSSTIGGGGGVDKGGSMENTFVVHSLVEPDPLSMIGSLSAPEREKVARVTFWALLRAALVGLAAALIIASADILSTYFILGKENESLSQTILASVGNSMLVITDSLFSWRPAFLEAWIAPRTEMLYTFLNNTHAGLPNGTIVDNTTDTYASLLANDGLSVSSLLLHNNEWKYRGASLAVALVVSIIEVVILYMDTLRVAFAMGKAGGIPLFHFANKRSQTFLRREENDMTMVRESLTRKRVRYVVTSLSKAALEDTMPTKTVLGINVHNTNLTWFHSLVQFLWPKLKRAVPTILLRVVSSALLSQYAIPFLATPLLVLWNFLTARNSVRMAKAVVLGVVAAEGVAAQLLNRYFSAPREVVKHNLNAHKQQHTASGCQAGEGVLIHGLHTIPFHLYKELLTLITFYMQMIGSGTVHPGLHFFLVHIVSHVQMPDVLCTYTSSKNRLRQVLGTDRTEPSKRELSPCDAALRDHLALLTYQWNASRQQMSGRSDWMDRFTDVHHGEASSSVDTASLRATCPHITPKAKKNEETAWVQHLLEVTFPSWCCVPLRLRWRAELYPNSGGDNSGECFSTTNVRLMLVVGILCVVLSGSFKISYAEEVFIQHLARVYLCAWCPRYTRKYGSAKEYMITSTAGRGLLGGVRLLKDRFFRGHALDVAHVESLIDAMQLDTTHIAKAPHYML